ncbi:MAG: phosphatase PAP2 family protein [Bacteroidales bacterium]|jgi:undecaprenyl-diphosphatase|nr:phosphatase PAP2 family protein [Bacteroidales bacterium]
MIEFIKHIDQSVFLFFNGLHLSFLDPIMKFISSNWFWIPIVLLFIGLYIKYFKKKFWIPIVFTIICFALTDSGATFVKNSAKRYRPSHNLEIQNQVHVVDNYRGGQYGFFSGHASNSFGLALLTLLFIRKKYYTIIVSVWAIIVSYSRIYVGVHYPLDIFCGFLYGILIATILYLIYTKFIRKFTNKIITNRH